MVVAETPGSCVGVATGVAVIVAVRAVVFVLIAAGVAVIVVAETPGSCVGVATGVAVIIAADSAGGCVVIADKTTGNRVLTCPGVAMFVVLIITVVVGFVVATGAVLFTITVVAEPETAANGVVIAAGAEVSRSFVLGSSRLSFLKLSKTSCWYIQNKSSCLHQLNLFVSWDVKVMRFGTMMRGSS